MESQPLQQTAAAMTVDFDAVFGNKATPSNNGPQPAAGKARSVWLWLFQAEPDWKLKEKNLFLAFLLAAQVQHLTNPLTSFNNLWFVSAAGLGVCRLFLAYFLH